MQNNSASLVLDTSFISALYKVDDALHNKALEIYRQQISNHEIIIPITVILELSLLSQAYNNFKNFQKYLATFNFTTCYLDIFFETELQTYLRETSRSITPKLKSMDLSILICALSNKSELITFDKKLLRVWEQMQTSYKQITE